MLSASALSQAALPVQRADARAAQALFLRKPARPSTVETATAPAAPVWELEAPRERLEASNSAPEQENAPLLRHGPAAPASAIKPLG